MVDHAKNRPFPAYRGEEPFVFISYSHRDSERVFQEITWLRDQGINIWYDEGIEAGREWRDEIASAIARASALIYFVTPDAAQSENCRNEVNFAADEQIPIVTIYLEKTELPGGLRLTLSNRQAILRYDLNPDEYARKLFTFLETHVRVAPDLTQHAPRSRSKRPVLLALGLILIPVVVWIAIWLQQDVGQTSVGNLKPLPEARLRSVAVLPFKNLSDKTESIADGISLDLVTGLSKIHDIRVAASTSSFAFKEQALDVGDIGRKLRVDTVLEGSFRVVDGTARVNAQLLLVEDGYQLWSERYDLPFTNALAVQDQVTSQILDSVRLHLIEREAFESGEVALSAYNLYLVARDNMRARTEDSLLVARAQFEESIALDPEFAPAWSDLARTIVLLSDLQYGEIPFVEAKSLAQEKIAKAFELEPDLASAFATEGFLLRNEGKQMEALSKFHRAIAIDPNDAYAHFMIAEVLAESGNFNDSFQELSKAYELDSHHPVIQYRMVQYYLALRDFDAVKRVVRPDQALLAEALIDFRQGREAEGIEKATNYLAIEESGFAGVHLRMDLARVYYYRLANLDMAQEAISESSAVAGRIFFQALDYPEVAYQLLRGIPQDYHSRFSKFLLARSQILTGRFDTCLTSLDYKSPEQTPVHGTIHLGLPGNDLTLAFFQAYCLDQLNRLEEANTLRQELYRYHQLAVQQGEPTGYERHLARLEILADNLDTAMDLLEQGYKNHVIDYTDIANPWYDELRHMPRFKKLETELFTHINQQRTLLGWSKIPIPKSAN